MRWPMHHWMSWWTLVVFLMWFVALGIGVAIVTWLIGNDRGHAADGGRSRSRASDDATAPKEHQRLAS